MSHPMHDMETFRNRYQPGLVQLAHLIQHQELLGAKGWHEQLSRTVPASPVASGWREDLAHRYRLQEVITDYLSGTRSFADATRRIIKHWGGIKQQLVPCLEKPVRETLLALLAKPDRIPEHGCGERIISVSRVYACLNPERWIVLDTRVSSGFARLLWLTGQHEDWTGHLGMLADRHPDHPGALPGFRRIWPSSRDHAFHSFVLTSWACQVLAGHLDHLAPWTGSDSGHVWTVAQVELVLARLAEVPVDRSPGHHPILSALLPG